MMQTSARSGIGTTTLANAARARSISASLIAVEIAVRPLPAIITPASYSRHHWADGSAEWIRSNEPRPVTFQP